MHLDAFNSASRDVLIGRILLQTSVNFDNPTKRTYAVERYQMFLWIFDKKILENAKNRHFLAQNVQIDNNFW